MGKYIDVVFDGPPGPEAGRFVEVEDASGKSIRVGEWVEDGDLWRLRISQPEWTVRDLFAAAALNGWIAGPLGGDVMDDYKDSDLDPQPFYQHTVAVARTAYMYADAMLAERQRRIKGGDDAA